MQLKKTIQQTIQHYVACEDGINTFHSQQLGDRICVSHAGLHEQLSCTDELMIQSETLIPFRRV